MTGDAIRIEDLGRRFGKRWAVQGITLDVKEGELFGLVGPDGSGKTTLIRILCTLLDPSAGRASVFGSDTRSQSDGVKRRIGYMAQRFNLYGDLSAEENLDFFADIYRVPGRARRVRRERLLAFARLTDFRSRRAAHLSGGMQKKLALACTLIHAPDLILLDEPTTGVDPVSRREFWDILSELHLQGVTILVSTPYMDEAERCSRVGLMYQGHMVICDTPARIKERVPGALLEVRTADLRRSRELAAGLPNVLEVQTYGDLLHVFVENAADGEAALRSAMSASGIDVLSLRQARPRMEEAFVSLVRRQAGGAP